MQRIDRLAAIALARAAGRSDRRLAVRERNDLAATQKKHQTHPLDAIPGSSPAAAEQLPVLPSQPGRLRAPPLEEPLGIDEELLPGASGPGSRMRDVPQEPDPFDPVGRDAFKLSQIGAERLRPPILDT